MFICGPGYMYDLSPLNRFLIALYRPRQPSDKAHKKYIHIAEEHYRKKKGAHPGCGYLSSTTIDVKSIYTSS